jgi:ribosomal-protein-alanine N-acetyltransferase
MSLPREISTPRLHLRRWRTEDREPYAALNADPRVMEHYPAPLSREESDAMVDRIEAHFEKHGYGLWAVDAVEEARFVGFIGLLVPRYEAHFTPAVEIGWRLAHDAWGRGYATEGARATLALAFGAIGLREVVATTAPNNLRSRRVMERLGMRHDAAGDFEHPLIPEGHVLRRQVLYRLPYASFDTGRDASS